MDNLTHTLVGAALARAGIRRATPLATATLLIGANLPDLDILWVLGGPGASLEFRRGWTHGLPALLVLPAALTALMVGWDRLVRRRTVPSGPASAARPSRPPDTPGAPGHPGSPGPPVSPEPTRFGASARRLLAVAFLGVATHPLLDFCNTYGMRWLMPFDTRWSYGDTLFIVDPWISLVLGVGLLVGRWAERRAAQERPAQQRAGSRPAAIALAIVALYVAGMAASNVAARGIVGREMRVGAAGSVRRMMVAPVAGNPFRRRVVVERPASYRFGKLDWLRRPVLLMEKDSVVRLPTHPAARVAARAAARTPIGRALLGWARYPFFEVETTRTGYTVYILDARYTRQRTASWGAVAVSLDRALVPQR